MTTYSQAREAIFAYVRREDPQTYGQRWTVKADLKVPQLITPSGHVVRFKAQAVYLDAHSLWIDIRKITPAQFLEEVMAREGRDPGRRKKLLRKTSKPLHGIHVEKSRVNQAWIVMWHGQVLRIFPTKTKAETYARSLYGKTANDPGRKTKQHASYRKASAFVNTGRAHEVAGHYASAGVWYRKAGAEYARAKAGARARYWTHRGEDMRTEKERQAEFARRRKAYGSGRDPEHYVGFSSWADVLAHVSAGHPTYYQAPMDYRAHRVHGKVRGRKIRIAAPSRESDAFTADSGHLGRFKRKS